VTLALALVLAVLVPVGAFAQGASVPPKSSAASKTAAPKGRAPKAPPRRDLDPSVFAVVEHELANGLKVRLVESRSVPTVSYYTFFRAGSRNERPGITGIAHLFEHMMFNGAAKYGPKEFDRVLESAGGTSNAYTSNDVTAYYEDFASNALETVIDLESDRMRALAITPQTLASEREVVKEERRFRVDNDVPGMLDEALSAAIWKAHPYRWPVIGWMGDLDAIRREDALAFFRTYYAPNNATIVAVGDLDPKATLEMIERHYGDIPAGPPVPEVVNSEPEPNGERRVFVEYPSQAPSVMVGFKVTAARDPDTFVLDVVQGVLAVGESSRLVKRLVYEEELATHVSVDFGWRIDPSSFVIFAELPPGGDPLRVEAVIYEELGRIAKEGIPDRELRKAKNGLRAHFLEEISTHNGRAHAIGHYELLLGDWRETTRTLERWERVTSADAKRVAAAYFVPRNRSVATLIPTAASPEKPKKK